MPRRRFIPLLFCMLSACKAKPEPVEQADAAVLPQAPPPPSASAPAPTPPAPKKTKLVLLAGGDVALGRGLGKRILEKPDTNPFAGIAPLLTTADLRFVNLESQLSDQGGRTIHPDNHLVFTGPPAGADLLARAGIDIVSVANNHMWDFGKKAFLETLGNLERAKVRYVGAHEEPNHAYQPTIVEVNGFKLAFFAVTHIWNQGPIDVHEGRYYVAWASYAPLEKRIKKAKQENDFVIVSYHGGGEYGDVPMTWTREFVNATMIKGGADAIIGHHPHVPHGVGWYGSRPAFFSLGNLVFEMHSDYPWTGTSFMARLTLNADGSLQAEACPYYIFAGFPMLFDGRSKQPRERALRQHLALISKSVGGSEVGEPGELSCMPLSPPVPKARPRR